MYYNMTLSDATSVYPMSGWRVLYFRVLGWESGNGKELIEANQDPVLEICFAPRDTDVEEFGNSNPSNEKEVGFKLPAKSVIVRVRVGDEWPLLPNHYLGEPKKAKDNEMWGLLE